MSASGKSSNRAYDERRWDHLNTRSSSMSIDDRVRETLQQKASSADTAKLRPAPDSCPNEGGSVFDRRRFDYTPDSSDCYGQVISGGFDERANGNCLSSLVSGSDQHAPVLDVDHPVSVIHIIAPDVGGLTLVRFTHRVSRRKVLNALRTLLAAGLVSSHTQASIDTLEQLEWHTFSVRGVDVYFDHNVISLDSKSPGHHHLLVERLVSWQQAQVLALQLGKAGLTDGRHAKVSARGDFLFVKRSR